MTCLIKTYEKIRDYYIKLVKTCLQEKDISIYAQVPLSLALPGRIRLSDSDFENEENLRFS